MLLGVLTLSQLSHLVAVRRIQHEPHKRRRLVVAACCNCRGVALARPQALHCLGDGKADLAPSRQQHLAHLGTLRLHSAFVEARLHFRAVRVPQRCLGVGELPHAQEAHDVLAEERFGEHLRTLHGALSLLRSFHRSVTWRHWRCG